MPSIADSLILVAEVVIKGSLAAAGSNVVPTATVTHWKRSSNVNPLSKANIAAVFESDIIDTMVLGMTSRWTCQSLEIRYIDDALDSPTSFPQTAVGAVATDGLPSDAAVYIHKKTGLRGRRYRGGMFLPGVAEAHTTGDVLNGTGQPLWEDTRAAFAAGFVDADGNNWTMAVVSKMPPSQLTVNPTTVVANQITQLLLNERVTDLDRRKSRSVY